MANTVSLASGPDGRKRRVSYFYEPVHPMTGSGKTFEFILKYQLQYYMEMCRPILPGDSDLLRFHTPEYVHFLSHLMSMTITDPSVQYNLRRFNLDTLFLDGFYDDRRACASGSLNAAVKLNRNEADIAINWAGGMSGVKPDKASGIGIFNDVVLGILELLKNFKRVLYIDIGYQRAEGVEEAFYNTDRVMTVSFHTFVLNRLLPSTGDRRELYSLNAPLNDALNDAGLRNLFVPVINKAMEVYQPEVIVLQCGADSLAGDSDGRFNLTVKGHGDCVQYIRSFNVPLMLFGGGHSYPLHVGRCWCYETAVAIGCGEILENELRVNEFPFKPNTLPDLNTPRDIATTRDRLLMQLSQIIYVPSVQFQDTPPISQAIEPAEVDMEKRQVVRTLKRSKL